MRRARPPASWSPTGTTPEVTRVARRWADETGGRVVWFSPGDDPEADVRARNARAALIETESGARVSGTRFTLELGEESIEIELPLHGRYNVANAVAAAAAARELGVTPEEIAAGLAAAAPADHRGSVHELAGVLDGAVLIDDSYNSNPDALQLALAGAAELAEAHLRAASAGW